LRVASDWFNTAQIRKKKIISIFSITSHTERPAHQVRLIPHNKRKKNYKNILVDEDAPADLPDHCILPNN
jgi:hypothetical protein